MAKICVTIGRGRHKALQEEWKSAAEAGANLVELRVDCLRREPDMKRIFSERHTPLVFTVRRTPDGGLWRGDEAKRQRLLREAIAIGVDYVDLEANIAHEIPRFGKTQRIISLHDLKGMPPDLPNLAKSLHDKDADVVKIAAIAHTVADAARMLEMVADAEFPVIGLAMGSLGVFTRVLGAKFGSPFTYAGFHPDRTFAPGMLQFNELHRDFEYEQIGPNTQVFAVIGDPIGHSLSPAVHNAAYRALDIDAVMVPLHIPRGALKESFETLQFLNLRGISVTIPHKRDIIALLDRSDRAVEMLGACNTVVVDDQGKRAGYNTDYRAAISSLEDALGGAMADDVSPLLDKQVLILGAGGVARSIAFGLARRGAGVTIANRHDEKAQQLAEEVGCRSTTWGMRAGTMCDVLVNCTPIGMHPEVDESPVPAAGFRPGMVAFDTVYHPENTLFLKLAQQHDCTIVTGAEMFVRQAALQIKHYTGENAPIDLMREVVRRKLSPAQ